MFCLAAISGLLPYLEMVVYDGIDLPGNNAGGLFQSVFAFRLLQRWGILFSGTV